VLTDYYTTSTADFRGDEDELTELGGDSDFDATDLLDASGQPYTTFANYWKAFEAHNDTFTPLARYNLSNVEESDIIDGLVVSGYGNNTAIAPQAFEAGNIILATDGQCASSCHTFSHMIRWQGKVKTVAFGGRPQANGQPMQYVGGVKGSEVNSIKAVLMWVDNLYDSAPEEVIQQADQTSLKTLHELGNYTLYRTTDPQGGSRAGVNYQNFIGQDDTSYTPLQFVYEAADCRVWFSLDMVFDISAIWKRAAREAFAIGPNATEVFAGCTEGSTNAPSSLSGNATLFADGKIANVTDFLPSTTDTVSEAGTSNSTQASSENIGSGFKSASNTGGLFPLALLSLVFTFII
jgi:hypothetical protein